MSITGSMAVQVGKIPETFSAFPEDNCDIQIIYFSPLNIYFSMQTFIVVPQTSTPVRENLLESHKHLF